MSALLVGLMKRVCVVSSICILNIPRGKTAWLLPTIYYTTLLYSGVNKSVEITTLQDFRRRGKRKEKLLLVF